MILFVTAVEDNEATTRSDDNKIIGSMQTISRREHEGCSDSPWTVNFGILDSSTVQWKDCGWLESRPNMTAKYCGNRGDIRNICLHTCNFCYNEAKCRDAPLTIKFKTNLFGNEPPDEDDLRTCLWLSQREISTKESFCERRVDVRKICPLTCNACTGGPTAPTHTPMPTQKPTPSPVTPCKDDNKSGKRGKKGGTRCPSASPSSSPTISQNPSSEPTRNPTSKPSSSPSSAPTESQDNSIFSFRVSDPSDPFFSLIRNCAWVAGGPKRINRYCHMEDGVMDNCRYTCCVCQTDDCVLTSMPSSEPSKAPSKKSKSNKKRRLDFEDEQDAF